MTNGETASDDDIALTGYLDGELAADEQRALDARLAADAALRDRLEKLRAARPSAELFDLLLAAAPHDRLAGLLAEAESRSSPVRLRGLAARRRLAVAAAVALLVLGGAAIGFGVASVVFPPEVQIAEEAPNWRAVVAEYLSLYTDETLAAIPDDPALRRTELAHAGERLSLPLSPEAVAVPGLTLKRTQLLAFNGMPLAQIAYRSGADGPVALCIIANGKPDAAPAFEERNGWNIVFWNQDGLGYMVIGHIPPETLEAMAASLEERV